MTNLPVGFCARVEIRSKVDTFELPGYIYIREQA